MTTAPIKKMRWEEREPRISRLIEILQKQGTLKGHDAEVLKHDFKSRSDLAFEEFLIDEGLVSRAELLKALQVFYAVPAIDVEGLFFERHLVAMFPQDVLIRNRFIPYDQDGDVLAVIAAHPDDADLLDIIGNYVSYDVTFLVGYASDIEDAIEDFYDTSVSEVEADQDLRVERLERHEEEEMTEEKDIRS